MEPNKESLSKEEMAKYDYIVMIDRSGSMSTEDCPGGKSRWEFAQEQTEAIARQVAKFDDNGIDIVLFASTPKLFSGVGADKVTQIFTENSPSGSTNTAAALKLVFDEYNKRKAAGNAKPIIVVCVTDGTPDNRDAVDKVIVDHANSLSEDGETGITFIQVGNDAGARAFLKHLDDDLQSKGAKYDIVDTKDFAEMENLSILEVVQAAILD